MVHWEGTLEGSVSRSGPVWFFALFLVQPDPDRSFYFSYFGQLDQNWHGPVANGCQWNGNRFRTGLYVDRSWTSCNWSGSMTSKFVFMHPPIYVMCHTWKHSAGDSVVIGGAFLPFSCIFLNSDKIKRRLSGFEQWSSSADKNSKILRTSWCHDGRSIFTIFSQKNALHIVMSWWAEYFYNFLTEKCSAHRDVMMGGVFFTFFTHIITLWYTIES